MQGVQALGLLLPGKRTRPGVDQRDRRRGGAARRRRRACAGGGGRTGRRRRAERARRAAAGGGGRRRLRRSGSMRCRTTACSNAGFDGRSSRRSSPRGVRAVRLGAVAAAQPSPLRALAGNPVLRREASALGALPLGRVRAVGCDARLRVLGRWRDRDRRRLAGDPDPDGALRAFRRAAHRSPRGDPRPRWRVRGPERGDGRDGRLAPRGRTTARDLRPRCAHGHDARRHTPCSRSRVAGDRANGRASSWR